MPDREERGAWFDRFAEGASTFTSHATFFVGCVLLVVIWAPTYFVIGDLDTWQLIINTATTIITFLLVALLQNSQRRSDTAVHEKLDAIADGLADLMEEFGGDREDFAGDIRDLRRAVGIEHPEDGGPSDQRR